MPCYAPLTAYYSKVVGASGKRGITFDRNASFFGVSLKLPCGQCVGCRLERSRQWAVRLMKERKFHDDAMFVTLTYDKDHLPEGNTLVVRDPQLFHKRLHNRLLKSRGVGIRFYYCGEYGDEHGRPHYHSIIFGYRFPDLRFYKRAASGESLYTSELLEEIWGLGLCVVGDVSFESCAYVARYVVKKVTGDAAAEHYDRVDADGVVTALVPEFTNMSRRPGIGRAYFDKFSGEVYAHDSIIVNAQPVRPPRYFDTLFDAVYPAEMAVIKRKRREVALRMRVDNTPDRRRVREVVQLRRLADRKRSVG